jgi:hypothetical protein
MFCLPTKMLFMFFVYFGFFSPFARLQNAKNHRSKAVDHAVSLKNLLDYTVWT